MTQLLSDKLKIVEQANDVALVYVDGDGTQKNILFNKNGVYLNTTNSILTTAMASNASSTLMPLSYSSAFQTATLSNTFQQTGLLAFANIVGFSITSTVNGISTTIAIKTA
jgi:hypothetical protein